MQPSFWPFIYDGVFGVHCKAENEDKAIRVEPYNASRLAIRLLLQFGANLVKVVAFKCARSRAHSRNAWAETLQMHGFPI